MSHLGSFAMIQHVFSNASYFTDCLEFILEFNLLLMGPDVCHPSHSIYLIFPSLGVMPRVPTALHLPITQDDEITRQLQIVMKTINFLYIHIVCCRNLQLTVR